MKNLLFKASRFVLSGTNYDAATVKDLSAKVSDMVKKILGPIFTVIGLAAVIYAIYLGVLYAKAESAEKRKEVQGRLIGACIGAVIIVAGATLCFALDWAAIFKDFSGVNVG